MRRVMRMGVALGVIGSAALIWGQAAPPALLPADGLVPPKACGTTRDGGLDGRVLPRALPNGLDDGEPFTFDQDPPLVFPDYSGALTLHNFSIVGDVPAVQFVRRTRDANGVTETWSRKTTRAVNGQLISVFEPSWSTPEVAASFAYRHIGYDVPYLFWGTLQISDTDSRYVYLRAGLKGIPASTVVRINDQVQYASDLVNIVVPTFDDARVSGGSHGFDVASALRLFYRYFEDAYDVVALQPQSVAMADYGAFHQNVRNGVSGINISIFDNSRAYGSIGTLQGFEVYADGWSSQYDMTDHEMSHQWASGFDWSRINGVARAGHQPTVHSPLWTGGETLVGAVLKGNRRVAGAAPTYAIEQTPAPAHFHPIELYALGLLPQDQVPDISLFADQRQFDPATSTSPDIGVRVTGDTVSASILDVVRVHGPRSGPAITSPWRRATVLVSHDRLASQPEMDYWNFFAQRLGDRNHASRPTYDNFASFRRATNNAVDLQTTVKPIGASAPPSALDIDTPVFGPSDLRDLTLTSTVPSRFAVGQTVTLSGRISATDAHDFTSVTLGFWPLNGTAPINFSAAVSASHDFTVTIRFTDAQRGRYYVADYLFWANSGSQPPRSGVSTISVE